MINVKVRPSDRCDPRFFTRGLYSAQPPGPLSGFRGQARRIGRMAADRLEALFAELFRDLAIAWRALSAYPRGHPAAVAGLAKCGATFTRVLAETGGIELSAMRETLLWKERRFTSPTAAQLAKLLRRRRAAGLIVEPGVTPEELETFLRSLALDNRSARAAGSLAVELVDAGLVSLRVTDLDYSSVALVEADEEVAAPAAAALASRLVRKLLATGGLPPAALAAWITSGRSAADLMQLLLDSGGADPALAGWGPAAFAAALRAAVEDFFESPDSERAAGIANLHQRLHGGDRERLILELALGAARSSASSSQGTALGSPGVDELQAALPAQIVAELRQAIVQASVREPGPGDTAGAAAPAPPRITAQQLTQLRRAFASDDLDASREDTTSTESLEVMLELPEERTDVELSPAAAEVGREILTAADRTATTTLLELAERIEVTPAALPPILVRLEMGFRRLLAAGRMRQATTIVEHVQRAAAGDGPGPTAFRRTAERMSARESLEVLLAALPDLPEEAFALLPELLQRLGPSAVRHALGVLAETDNRQLRHRLLDLLARLGPAVVRDATALLADSRWYVVRNMLLLLRRVGDPGSVPAVRKCADHPDLRVRLEAIRNLFAFDPDVPSALLRRALTHPDPRQAEAAMELAGEHRIAEAVEPIVTFLQALDLFGRRRSVRLKAIRALAAIGEDSALAGLGRFQARFQLLPPALEERRELYRTLAAYSEEARRPLVTVGLRSRDAEIRRLSEGLAHRPEETP
jgi:hypothetical protein